MGRSRAVSHAQDEDANQRSKRKKTASTSEIPETKPVIGHGTSEDKRALYHCNYCHKNISGKIRIKCVICSDFDLCIECFSVGAEVSPHKSNHSYRVMDNLSFPLISPDWNADEEILLLEAIEMYGLGNWMEVSEHVATKSKLQCIEHYNTIYMSSPCFPLPDLSHVMGKTREELLAMAEGLQGPEEHMLKEESPIYAGIKVEELIKETPKCPCSSSLTSGVGSGMGSSSDTSIAAVKKASNVSKTTCDRIKVEVESQSDRSVGEKKPRIIRDEGPSIIELSGYNIKREEFENEYDNEAEQLLADMEFYRTDTEAERELKLRVLRIYNKRLDERKRRKAFIIERNLLYPDPFMKNLSPQEKQLCQKHKVFMRFQSKEEHEQLLTTVIEEHRILKKIQDLQEARVAGCRTSTEAETFLELKRRKEAQVALEGKVVLRTLPPKVEVSGSPREGVKGPKSIEFDGTDLSSKTAGQDLGVLLDVWDISGFPEATLLSESEKQLCGEIRILPSHYLNMVHTISIGMLDSSITQKSDAHKLFKVDSSKVDRIYDMVGNKGIPE